VGDDIFLAKERVDMLTSRLKKWIALRRTLNKDKKVAILVYGFPPGVGATGTAALLNVPKSLEAFLTALQVIVIIIILILIIITLMPVQQNNDNNNNNNNNDNNNNRGHGYRCFAQCAQKSGGVSHRAPGDSNNNNNNNNHTYACTTE
jgi:hypothetical protein